MLASTILLACAPLQVSTEVDGCRRVGYTEEKRDDGSFLVTVYPAAHWDDVKIGGVLKARARELCSGKRFYYYMEGGVDYVHGYCGKGYAAAEELWSLRC